MTTETRKAKVRTSIVLLFLAAAAFETFQLAELKHAQNQLKRAHQLAEDGHVASQEDLQWHPSKITCPDDKWDSHGYTLVRIEGSNGQEWCMSVVRISGTAPKAKQ